MLKNLKNSKIGKISVIGTSAVLLGATAVGGIAAGLDDFPLPFVVEGSGVNNALIIHGNADVAAAVDIQNANALNERFNSWAGVTDVAASYRWIICCF